MAHCARHAPLAMALALWCQGCARAPARPAPVAAHMATPIGSTFAAPDPERVALQRADALLGGEADIGVTDADALIDALNRAAARQPTLAYDVFVRQARLLGRSGRLGAAAQAFRRAADAVPHIERAAQARLQAALCDGAAGRRAPLALARERWPLRLLALPHWEAQVLAWAAPQPTAPDLVRALSLVAALGHDDARRNAHAALDTRIALQPDAALPPDEHMVLVSLVLPRRGADAAAQWLQSLPAATTVGPESVPLVRLRAEIDMKARRYPQAIARWQSIASRGERTEQANAWGRMGHAWQAQEHYEEAALALARAARLADAAAEREEYSYQAATLWFFAGLYAQSTQAFEHWLLEHPGSRHATSAMWFEAFGAHLLYDDARAIRVLLALAERDDPALTAQAEYWLGRLYAARGALARAAHWYRRAASHPRSYYAYLAAHRLPSIAARPVAATMPLGTDALAWRSPLGQRLAALLAIGLVDDALADVPALGPRAGASVAEASLARAELYNLHGQPQAAAQAAEMALLLAHERPLSPAGTTRAEQLSFAHAFDACVRHSADTYQVAPDLIWSVMRQESLFLPTARSTSNARGLMQLLPKTSTRIAQAQKRPPLTNDEAVEVPSTNIDLGAWYLSALLHNYGQQTALAVAAYNAGPLAVNGWLFAAPLADIDTFIELLPKHETRRYSKRVLSNLATYARLAGRTAAPLTPLSFAVAHTIDF